MALESKNYWDSIVDTHIKQHFAGAFAQHSNAVGALSLDELGAAAGSGSFPTNQEWVAIFNGYYQAINNGNWQIAFSGSTVATQMIDIIVNRFVNDYDVDKKRAFVGATVSLLNLALFSWGSFRQIVTHPDMVTWFQSQK